MIQTKKLTPTTKPRQHAELQLVIGETKFQTSIAEYYHLGIKPIAHCTRSLEAFIINVNCI